MDGEEFEEVKGGVFVIGKSKFWKYGVAWGGSMERWSVEQEAH